MAGRCAPQTDLKTFVRVILHLHIIELEIEGLYGCQVSRRSQVPDCRDTWRHNYFICLMPVFTSWLQCIKVDARHIAMGMNVYWNHTHVSSHALHMNAYNIVCEDTKHIRH